MDIFNNGSSITYSEEEIDEVHNLMCVCVHKLYLHASWTQFYYPTPHHLTSHQSQCTACGITDGTFDCPRFRMK